MVLRVYNQGILSAERRWCCGLVKKNVVTLESE